MSYYFRPWDFAIGRVPAQIANHIRRALGQFLNRFNQHLASREYFQHIRAMFALRPTDFHCVIVLCLLGRRCSVSMNIRAI
jgi:hypothetical protein